MNLISVTSWYGKTSAIDTVDGASTGIALCQIAFLLRDADSLLMSGIDRPEPQLSGAASLGKADLRVTLDRSTLLGDRLLARLCQGLRRGANKVVVIDKERMEVVQEIPTGTQPFGLIVMSPPV